MAKKRRVRSNDCYKMLDSYLQTLPGCPDIEDVKTYLGRKDLESILNLYFPKNKNADFTEGGGLILFASFIWGSIFRVRASTMLNLKSIKAICLPNGVQKMTPW